MPRRARLTEMVRQLAMRSQRRPAARRSIRAAIPARRDRGTITGKLATRPDPADDDEGVAAKEGELIALEGRSQHWRCRSGGGALHVRAAQMQGPMPALKLLRAALLIALRAAGGERAASRPRTGPPHAQVPVPGARRAAWERDVPLVYRRRALLLSADRPGSRRGDGSGRFGIVLAWRARIA